MRRRILPAVLLTAAALGLAACGSSSSSSQKSTASTSTTSSSAADAAQIQAASRSAAADFPKPNGRSLQALTKDLNSQVFLAPAASTFVPGTQRIPFALLNSSQKFVYGETATYVADSPNGPARGPYVAP